MLNRRGRKSCTPTSPLEIKKLTPGIWTHSTLNAPRCPADAMADSAAVLTCRAEEVRC